MPLALVVIGAGIIAYSGARITESLTDDPDRSPVGPWITAAAFATGVAATLWWLRR